MKLSGEAVVAASSSWIWMPDTATVTETDEYLIGRFPDSPTGVLRPSGTLRGPLELAKA
jgi:hypothetical protein